MKYSYPAPFRLRNAVYAVILGLFLSVAAAFAQQTVHPGNGGGHDNEDCFEGSVNAPIPHCHGVPGPAGPQGPEGPMGPQGPQGEPGAVGPQGPAGADGAPGAPGIAGPVGPAGANGLDGAPGRDGRDGLDGKDGKDGKDAPNAVVIREIYMHADWRLPVPFVPGVDRAYTFQSATPDRFGYIAYYFRAAGPYQGYFVIINLNAQTVLAIRRGGEVPLWSDIGQVMERTFVFTGPTENGQLHACVLNLTTILNYAAAKGRPALWFPLSQFMTNGEIPTFAVLDEH